MQVGDVVSLGPHRLMCGDSTNPEHVVALMNGERAEMMFTDPPYGVAYEGGHFHSGNVNIQRKRKALAGDADASIYARFLPVALQHVDGPCYLWFAPERVDVSATVNTCGGSVSSLIVWHKTNATYAAMGAQYKQRHECCLYFKPKGSTLRWCGASNERTVWEMKRDPKNIYHPTQKPVELAQRALRNHTAITVADFFGGSGSTLIAAEQEGRRAFVMELDPTYCSVIIDRYEQMTQQPALIA